MVLPTETLQRAQTEGVRIGLREYTEKQYPVNLQNVHTPFPLVREMIDKLPSLEGYILTFNMEFVEVLIYDYNVDPKMIYFLSDCSEKVDIIKGKKRYEGVRAIKCDVLNNNTRFNMKFDVICGNPPYQDSSGNKGSGHTLWDKFVNKSFEVVKDDGYVCLVHPNGYRDVGGAYTDLKNLILQYQIHHMELHGFDDGYETFGVGTAYDWYVIQKTKGVAETTLKSQSGEIYKLKLADFPFIPNGKFDEIFNLIAKDGEEKVEVMFSRSAYGGDKSWVSKIKCDIYQYPVVYTITKSKGLTFFYSQHKDNGMFGIPKLIWSNGLGTYPIVDDKGEYGMTQWCDAIVDDVKILPKIKEAMETPRFIELMHYCKFTNNKYNRKVIALFRKDFWKDFV